MADYANYGVPNGSAFRLAKEEEVSESAVLPQVCERETPTLAAAAVNSVVVVIFTLTLRR
jgi:hypothetical protein